MVCVIYFPISCSTLKLKTLVYQEFQVFDVNLPLIFVLQRFTILLFLACKIGFSGPNCSQPCRHPNYGYLCQKQCNCSNDLCNHISGCGKNQQGKLLFQILDFTLPCYNLIISYHKLKRKIIIYLIFLSYITCLIYQFVN